MGRSTRNPDCHHRYLLVADGAGTPPTAREHVGVCERCGLFVVQLSAGKATVATTFRLNERQARAAGKQAATKN